MQAVLPKFLSLASHLPHRTFFFFLRAIWNNLQNFNLTLAHFILHAVIRTEVLKLEVPQNWRDPLTIPDSQTHGGNV